MSVHVHLSLSLSILDHLVSHWVICLLAGRRQIAMLVEMINVIVVFWRQFCLRGCSLFLRSRQLVSLTEYSADHHNIANFAEGCDSLMLSFFSNGAPTI